MTSELTSEKIACREVLAAVATLHGNPTPKEFDALLAALNTLQPLPSEPTLEHLLLHPPDIDPWLPQIQTPDLQHRVYRGAYAITQARGMDPQKAAILEKLATAFQLSPEMIQELIQQPLAIFQANDSDYLINSPLTGITALIHREGKIRRLIFDYALGAAIVGLIPITGGGSLEVKLLVVLGLILKMIWDVRKLWGNPRGQDLLAMIGNGFGFLGALMAGAIAWVTMIALGIVFPYVGAFGKAVGFATATWVIGQSTNQFYLSQRRPDLAALNRAFPNLISLDRPSSPDQHQPSELQP